MHPDAPSWVIAGGFRSPALMVAGYVLNQDLSVCHEAELKDEGRKALARDHERFLMHTYTSNHNIRITKTS